MVVDNMAVFPKYTIKITKPNVKKNRNHIMSDGISDGKIEPAETMPFFMDNEDILVFNDEEKEKVTKYLGNIGINYSVKNNEINSNIMDKAKNIKYNSRTEVLKHIDEDIEPQSMFLPNLVKRLEKRNQEIEAEITRVKNDVSAMKKERGDMNGNL